jgi:hypothetical protein
MPTIGTFTVTLEDEYSYDQFTLLTTILITQMSILMIVASLVKIWRRGYE